LLLLVFFVASSIFSAIVIPVWQQVVYIESHRKAPTGKGSG
jgi:hypothetical protein